MGYSRLQSRRRHEQGSKLSRVAIAVLSTIGVIDTGSITFNRWGILGSLSCPGGAEGCDKVLNSSWGILFENQYFIIPLSLIGLLSYTAILLLAVFPLIPSIQENKNNHLKITWNGLLLISFGMSIFSIILIALMIYKIKAFCFFCILSAIISILIFLLSLFGGSWENYGQLFFRGILLSLSIVIGSLIWSSSIEPNKSTISNNPNLGSPPIVKSISNPNQIKFAKYLTSKNISMYSAYWCPHCHDQKELFGKEASNQLVIVECAKDGLNSQSELCDQKEIISYPSWEINGKIDSGVKSLEDLVRLSGYKGSIKN